jgi:hybrid cluster-associated redox disulfide protein
MLEEIVMDMLDSQDAISAESLVQEVVRDHPETVLVFVRHGMQCVGCTMSPFHTVADSAREHAVALEPLLGALNHVTAGQEPA